MDIFRFFPGYDTFIYQTGREPAFFMFAAFIVTYLLARGYTRIARKTGWGSASFGGVHTHHMIFGLVIAFAASALEFGFQPKSGAILLLLATAFGIGAALVLDEFALMFHLQDVYWDKEGRKSVDAVVLAVAFGSLFLLQATPFGLSSHDTAWLVFFTVVLNLTTVLVSAAKGKIYIAMFGLFIPILALVGAVRLAEPDSIWARKIYVGRRSKRLLRSKKRYAKYESTWRQRKEKAWDVIGGKTGRPPFTPKNSSK